MTAEPERDWDEVDQPRVSAWSDDQEPDDDFLPLWSGCSLTVLIVVGMVVVALGALAYSNWVN